LPGRAGGADGFSAGDDVEDVMPVVAVLRRALREGLVPVAICELSARANISSLVKVGMTCLGSAIVAIVDV
jgi:hypothetical protein